MDKETKEFLGIRAIIFLACLLMLIAGYLIATLPDGQYCKITYKNGGSIEMPKSICKTIHTRASLEKEVNEIIANPDSQIIDFEEMLKQELPEVQIGFDEPQECPPCKSCPECPQLLECKECPKCVVPKCECPDISPALEHKLLNIRSKGNEHAFFQQGFQNCKKKIREEIIG